MDLQILLTNDLNQPPNIFEKKKKDKMMKVNVKYIIVIQELGWWNMKFLKKISSLRPDLMTKSFTYTTESFKSSAFSSSGSSSVS